MVDTATVDVVTSDGVTDSPESTQQTSKEPNYEALASEMGWTPEEKFRGDPTKWVDAKTFYEKGQYVLPIVKSQLKEAKRDADKFERELNQTRQDTIALKKQNLLLDLV